MGDFASFHVQQNTRCNLLDLPNELILLIAEYILKQRDLYRFIRVNRRTRALLSDVLFRRNIEHQRSSALQWAVRNERVEAVVRFLRLGADIDTTSGYLYRHLNLPPIFTAVLTHNLRIVKILVNEGAQLGKAGLPCDFSPLAIAIHEGYIKIARVLINEIQDLDEPIKDDLTPLAYACKKRHFEIFQYLLDKGATPRVPFKQCRKLLATRDAYEHRLDDVALGMLRLLFHHGFEAIGDQQQMGESHTDPRVRYLFFVASIKGYIPRERSDEHVASERQFAIDFPRLESCAVSSNVAGSDVWTAQRTESLKTSLVSYPDSRTCAPADDCSPVEVESFPRLGRCHNQEEDRSRAQWTAFLELERERSKRAETELSQAVASLQLERHMEHGERMRAPGSSSTSCGTASETATEDFPSLVPVVPRPKNNASDAWVNFTRRDIVPSMEPITVEPEGPKEEHRKRKNKWKKLQL
jgi:hypothetical protein